MKQRILFAALALAGTAAFAQNTTTSTSLGTANTVSAVSSGPVLIMNQTATHTSLTASSNTSNASGGAAGGPFIVTGNASGDSAGATLSVVTGIGTGGAMAVSGQIGQGDSLHSASPTLGSGGVTVQATGTVGTFSGAQVNNTGLAASTSNGNASADTAAAAQALVPGTSNAVGLSNGTDTSNLLGAATPGSNVTGGGLLSGGASSATFNNFNGSITRP